MKGHVDRRGKTYRYFFDGDPDPLTGKRQQVTKAALSWNAGVGGVPGDYGGPRAGPTTW